MAAVDLQRAEVAQSRLVAALAGQSDVNGVGISRAENGYQLKVNVRTPSAAALVPREYDGVTVEVQTVGRLRRRPVT